MAKERKPIGRRILANPDEPRAGDNVFDFYNKAHPVFGEPETISYLRGQLRGLRGKTITLKISGIRQNEDGDERRFVSTKKLTVNNYSDIFGTGGAFIESARGAVERDSEDKLVVQTFTIEEE